MRHLVCQSSSREAKTPVCSSPSTQVTRSPFWRQSSPHVYLGASCLGKYVASGLFFVRYKNCFVADEDLQASCESCGCYVPECPLRTELDTFCWWTSFGTHCVGSSGVIRYSTEPVCVCMRTCVCVCVCVLCVCVCEYVHRMSPKNNKHIVSCQGMYVCI